MAPEPAAGDDPRQAPRCPHCGAGQAEVISLFGTQAVSLQYRCRSCREVFEAIKYDADDPAPPGGGHEEADRR